METRIGSQPGRSVGGWGPHLHIMFPASEVGAVLWGDSSFTYRSNAYSWWFVSGLDWTVGHPVGVRELLRDQVRTLEVPTLKTLFWKAAKHSVSAVPTKRLQKQLKTEHNIQQILLKWKQIYPLRWVNSNIQGPKAHYATWYENELPFPLSRMKFIWFLIYSARTPPRGSKYFTVSKQRRGVGCVKGSINL